MANWKKVVVSGSKAHLEAISASNIGNYEVVFGGNSAGSLVSSASLTFSASTLYAPTFSGIFVGDGSNLTGLATVLQISASGASGSLSLVNSGLEFIGEQNQVTTTISASKVVIGLADHVVISGSLVVTGSVASTDTGSFAALYTPAGVVNAITASYAINAKTTALNSGKTIHVTPATASWILPHNLDEAYPLVQVYDDTTNKQVQPNEIEAINANLIKVTFTSPISGWANISRAGHVVSGSLLWTDLIPNPGTDAAQVDVNLKITGSLAVSGTVDFTKAIVSGSIFSGSFVGDGSGLTGVAAFLVLTSSYDNTSASIDLKQGGLVISGSNGVRTSISGNVLEIALSGSLVGTNVTFQTLTVTTASYLSGSTYVSGAFYLNNQAFPTSSGQYGQVLRVDESGSLEWINILAGSGSTVKLFQSVAATTWSFQHNLDEKYPVIQVYGTDDKVIEPSEIVAVNGNLAYILFPSGVAVAGTAVATAGGVSSYTANAIYAQTASYSTNFKVEDTLLATAGKLEITGSVYATGSAWNLTQVGAISGSVFSGSFVGDGSGLTGIATSLSITSSYDNTSASIDLRTQGLIFSGSSGIKTSVSGNVIEIALSGSLVGKDVTFETLTVTTASYLSGSTYVSGALYLNKQAFPTTSGSYGQILKVNESGSLEWTNFLQGSGSTVKLYQTVGATTWSFQHNLGEKYPVFEVYDSANEVIFPDKIVAVNPNLAYILFPSGVAFTGTAVATAGGVASYTANAVYAETASYSTDFVVENTLRAVDGRITTTGSLYASGGLWNLTSLQAISGSVFSGSFVGDGSGLTGIATSLSITSSYDNTSASVDLRTQGLIFSGSNGVRTSISGNVIEIALSGSLTGDNLTLQTLTVTTASYLSGSTYVSGAFYLNNQAFPTSSGQYGQILRVDESGSLEWINILVGSGSTVKHLQTVAATTWSFQHNLDEKYPVIQVYDSNDEFIIPDKIEAVNANLALIYFPSAYPYTGTAVASAGGVASYTANAIYAETASYSLGLTVKDTLFTSGGLVQITGSVYATGSVWNLTKVGVISGSVFSGSFVGDGSGLTGIATALNFTASYTSASVVLASSSSVNLKNQAVTFKGTENQVSVVASASVLTFGLTDDVNIVNNLTVGGNLTIAGTTTTVDTENLVITDRWALLASGSNTSVDGGIIVQKSGSWEGWALGIDASATRWALQANLGDSYNNNITPDAYLTTTQFGAANTRVNAPTYGSGSFGYGNMWVSTDTGEIFIWA